MRTQTLLVTPDLAHTLLKRNSHNRSLSKFNVQFLAEEIRSGRWKTTHQGIAVSSDGTLLDGQHRLAAIIEADQPALINVNFDCDPEIFTVIDTGRARTGADALRIAGAKTSYETTISAAARAVLLYRKFPGMSWSGSMARVSPQVVVDVFNQDPDLYCWAASLGNSARNELNVLRLKSATAAFAVIAIQDGSEHGVTKDDIHEFVMSVASGTNLSKGDARMTFRQQLINGWVPGQQVGQRDFQIWVGCWIKLFNLYWSGTSCKVFKTPNLMPMPQLMF